MFLMLNEVSAIGASLPIKSNFKIQDHFTEVILNSTDTTKISVATVVLQGGSSKILTCVNSNPGLAIGAVPQNIKTGTFNYCIKGVSYNKTTVANGVAPTDVRTGAAFVGTITGSKYGGVIVLFDSSGNERVLAPAATQAYDTAILCNAALDALPIPESFCKVGKVVIAAAGGGFTFGTTALTGIATYYDESCPYYPLETYPLDANDITNQRAMFQTNGAKAKYIRIFLSELTGTGKVTVKYMPVFR